MVKKAYSLGTDSPNSLDKETIMTRKTNAFGVTVFIREVKGYVPNRFVVYMQQANGLASRPFPTLEQAKTYANEVASYDGSDDINV